MFDGSAAASSGRAVELMLIGPQEERWTIASSRNIRASPRSRDDPRPCLSRGGETSPGGDENSRLIRHAVLPVGKTSVRFQNNTAKKSAAQKAADRVVRSRLRLLARSTRVFQVGAEQLPALAVELHHLQLLVDTIIGGHRGAV